MRPVALSSTFLALLVLGCASTTVRKNPGPHDRGIRYNLPKPYLLLQPSAVLDDKGQAVKYIPNKVSITLEMHPDFSEEYSIHIRAGVGANKTTVTLDEGWKLTQVNLSIDSKTSENIGAIAELIGDLPKFGKSGAVGAGDSGPVELATNVPAYNVPLGYYESVIGVDPCGKKQLYGWRYIGFMPFNPCPTNAHGGQAADCCGGDIFGLVHEKGVMVFKRLDVIAASDVQSRVKPAEKK